MDGLNQTNAEAPAVLPVRKPNTNSARLSVQVLRTMRQGSMASDLFADMSHNEELEGYLKRKSATLEFEAESRKSAAYDSDSQYDDASVTSRDESSSPGADSSDVKTSEESRGSYAEEDKLATMDVDAAALMESEPESPCHRTSIAARPPPRGDSQREQLENLLLSTSKVGKVCLLTPRAGPFEGQFVALITVSRVPPANNQDIALAPQSEDQQNQRQIHTLKTAIAEWGSHTRRPDVWIPLESMPLNLEGDPDSRKMQTWVQNIGEEMESRIMPMQIHENLRPADRRRIRESVPDPRISRSMSPPKSEAAVAADLQRPRSLGDDIPEETYSPLAVMQQLFFRTSVSRGIDRASVTGPDFLFNQSVLLRVNRIKGSEVQLTDIKAAVNVLVSRHSMLRARFHLMEEGWAQVIASDLGSSYRFENRHISGDVDLSSAIEQAQHSLDIFNGPVFAAEHMKDQNGQQFLYLAANRLVVDAASWQILVHDLDELLREGALVSEPSTPFTKWTDYQNYQARERLIEPMMPFEIRPSNLEYWALEGRPNLYGDSSDMTFLLPAEIASALKTTCNNVFRTDSADLFLAALLFSFQKTFPDRDLPTAWKQDSGRDAQLDDFNISQTVGSFTTLYPIGVPAKGSADLVEMVKMVKDARLSIPPGGSPFFSPKFAMSPGGTTSMPVEIMFNCADTLDQLERKDGALEPISAPDRRLKSLKTDIGPAVGRITVFEVSVAVDDSGVRVEFLYNHHSNHQERLKVWMRNFDSSIVEIVRRLKVMKPQLTLADVPFLDTTYQNLSTLANKRLEDIGLKGIENIETMRPVDPLLQEMLIAQGMDPACFHISRIYELATPDGSPVDQSRLCAAWETLVASHGALRSIFIDSVTDSGLFDQVILKKISPAMLFIDSADPVETLSSVPPMKPSPAQPRHRLSVSQSRRRTCLRFDCSQTLCDFSAIHNLVSQLRQLYIGNEVRIMETLPPRQKRQDSIPDSSRSHEVWAANLGGTKPCIFPHLAIHNEERLVSRGMGLDISRQEIAQCCNDLGLRLSTVIQLAWAFVLRTYVGEDRLVFGCQTLGKNEATAPGMGQYVGSLSSFVPCMVEFSPMSTVRDALKRLEAMLEETQAMDVPTQAEIEHVLGLRGKTLFNTCVTCLDLEDTMINDGPQTACTWEPMLLANTVDGNCDLSLCVTMRDDRIQADVSYKSLSTDQLHSVMNTFQRALQIIISSPQQALAQVDLFTEHDFNQIMYPEWEHGQTDTKIAACLNDLIISQCQARPNATAIYAWDGELSYHQVESYVNRLATYLASLGVGPGILVPIVLEKSLWSPIIMLSVIHAGGCFVCLDAQDMAMTEALIRQLGPPLVVVTEGAWQHVSQYIRNCVLVNETFLSSLPPQATVLAPEAQPHQAACAFISPGSSKPKGVFFTHESLCSILSVQGPTLKINERSRVLQLSAYTVDVALVETLGTFLHGGCVCIPSALERANDLEGTIARMDISWTYMTTVLSRKINPSTVPNLQTICFRTRTLDEDTFKPWLGGDRDVLLAYGAPDVCPLAISVYTITEAGDSNIIAPPMLGRFLILNPEDPKKLMPLGAVGELAIDSPIVTPHKYAHGRPLVDPASLQDPKAQRKWRYLRTGHRVRYLDRGHVRFLSSMRDDVFVNGSQTMTADLERHIRQCLGGDVDVAVESVATNDNITSLAAFLEFGDGEFRGPSELDKLTLEMRSKVAAAKWLAETAIAQASKRGDKPIPPGGMPTLFIPVRRFPLSTSLKINRRKLQKLVAPFSCSTMAEISNAPFSQLPHFTGLQSKPLPVNKVEESMRLIWSAVLHCVPNDINPCDSFFDVGGDRLLAMRLVLSCRQNGFDVTITDVLNGATLTNMCRQSLVKDTKIIRASPEAPKVAAVPRSTPSPGQSVARKMPEGADHGFIKLVIAPQLGVPWNDVIDVSEASSYQLHSLEPSLYGPRTDVSCLVLDFNGAVNKERLEGACEALTRLHPALRTAFAVHDSILYQVAIQSFVAELEHRATATWNFPRDAEQIVKRFQKEALQLRIPATKFAFLDAGQQGKLIVRLSSAQVSESTYPRLVQDFVKLYEHPDGELRRTSFFDYTRALRGARYEDSIHHWRRQLDQAAMTEIVPHERPRGPTSLVRNIRETVKVNQLNDFGITFDSVLKAAWATVLATLSGKSDVVFGEVVEGRRLKLETTVDVSSIAGPMENVVPVRVRFPIVNSSPLQILQLIQHNSASALPFEAAGAQRIIQECTDWPDWTRFSTVVRHRSQVYVDGTTTLNMDNTTFKYSLVQPPCRDTPDLFATSTMVKPGEVALDLEYAPARVPGHLAEQAMVLLAAAVETMACYDTISQPILQPSTDYEVMQPRVLRSQPESAEEFLPRRATAKANEWLLAPQRASLEQFLRSKWDETLPPNSKEMKESKFFEICGSVLPAYVFAETINRGLRLVEIPGSREVRVSPAEVIYHSTIMEQMDLITTKLQELGLITKPTSSKKGSGLPGSGGMRHKQSLLRRWRHGGSGGSATGSKGNNTTGTNSTPGHNHSNSTGSGGASLTRVTTTSFKDRGFRASDWVKHRVNLSKEKSPALGEGLKRRDTSNSPPVHSQDASTVMRGGGVGLGLSLVTSRGIETVPEAAVEIGTSAVANHARPAEGGAGIHSDGESNPDVELDGEEIMAKGDSEGDETGSDADLIPPVGKIMD